MSKLEIHPFSEDFRGEAASLLRERHERHRQAEPLLADVPDYGEQIGSRSGAVATRDGNVVAYLVAEVGERAVVDLAGCAASEPEALRDLYASLAGDWPSQHQVMVPATEAGLIDVWVRLAFGCQFVTAARETGRERPPKLKGKIRESRREDAPALAAIERELWTLQAGAPSFSGLTIPTLEEFERDWVELFDAAESPYPLHVVAEVAGEVVGHLLLYTRPAGDLRIPAASLDLALAGTRSDVRGNGVGTALTMHAIRWAHDHDYRAITTDWRSVNLLSSRFWPNRGFRPTFLRLYRAVP